MFNIMTVMRFDDMSQRARLKIKKTVHIVHCSTVAKVTSRKLAALSALFLRFDRSTEQFSEINFLKCSLSCLYYVGILLK